MLKYTLLLIAAFSPIPLKAEPVLVDRLVAVVNGEVILQSDVQKKIDGKLPIDVSSYPASKERPLFEQSLQDSINFLLIEQEADKMNIEFDDNDVEGEIKKTFASRGLDFGNLMEDLRKRGVSYEQYKKMYRKSMVLRRFQQAAIMPLIKLTDKDLETYYMKKTGQQSSNLKVTLKQIMIAVGPTTNSEVAEGKKKLANKVYRDLQGGLDFSEAVKIYSDDSSGRDSGGDMGTVRLNDLNLNIRKAVESLQEGQFSRPVQTANGYHIFKLEKKQFTGSSDFEKIKPRLEHEMRVFEIDKQTQKWLAERRQRSELKIIN
ncbi:peptidylprolyl isomerase [Oligoflexaceae bacterium]|nr:peptidylprolyl isomerase [Oligoflexaceae bacterium]